MTTTLRAPAGGARHHISPRAALLLLAAFMLPNTVGAQDKGTLNPQPLPPLAHPEDPKTPAKELFGRKATPAALQSRTIGCYSKGCLSGAQALYVARPGPRCSRGGVTIGTSTFGSAAPPIVRSASPRAAARGRWLQQGARALVHPCDPASQARPNTAAATSWSPDVRTATGVPPGSLGAVRVARLLV